MPRSERMDRSDRGFCAWGMPRASLLALALLGACSPAPPERLPGAWWVGERSAVEDLLDQTRELGEAPLGLRARALLAALPPECPRLGAHDPEGRWSVLAQTPRCVGADDPLQVEFERARRDDVSAPVDLLLSGTDASGHPVAGRLHLDGEGVALKLDWTNAKASGAFALLLPGTRDAGPDRLARTDRLLHLQVRPEHGLDLAALAPPESQADRLFRLRSALFESAVLDGVWEFGLYEAERAGRLPSVALALGVRSRRAAGAAAEQFAAELASTWSVKPSPLQQGPHDGACLLELNVLPELAPCYVVTDHALVIGWNPRSLERALEESSESYAPGAPAQLDLNLEGIARGDALAAQHLAESLGAAPPVIQFPWQRLSARARNEDGRLRIQARLELPGPS